MKQTSDDIARESDQHRANVSGLIEELRNRLTAGEVVDEVLSSDTLHQLTRNFGQQVKNNPLALTMIGGGLALLILGGKKAADNISADRGSADNISAANIDADGAATTGGTGGSFGDAKDRIKDTAQAAKDQASETASDAAAAAKDYAAKARNFASDTANTIADKGSAFLKKSKSGATLDRWAREQPLLLAGVGLALGVLLGAGVPLSDTENELMGEESDRFRGKAAEMAHEGIAKTKEATSAGYQAARDKLRESRESPRDDSDMPQGGMPDDLDQAIERQPSQYH